MPYQKNRKPDTYYIDQYDRITIESLKKLEVKEKESYDTILTHKSLFTIFSTWHK